MRHINYKSDFDFVLKLVSCVKAEDGTITKSEVGFPGHDWEATFWTSRKSMSFVASSKGGVLTNCFNDAGQIHVVCNNRGLGPGVLNVEFHAHVPNSMYPDKCMDIYTVVPLDIELVIGESDCMTELDAEVGLPIMYRSVYEDAVKAGFEGTQEEYYQRLNELPDSVEVATTIRQSVAEINEASKGISTMVTDMTAGKKRVIDALARRGYELPDDASYDAMADAIEQLSWQDLLAGLGYDCEEDYALLKEHINKAIIAKQQYDALGYLRGCDTIAPKVSTSGAYLFMRTGSTSEGETLRYVPKYVGLTDCSHMFYGCKSLTEDAVSSLDTRNVANMSYMFYGCDGFKATPQLDMSNVIIANRMFSMCKGLEAANCDMSNVTEAEYMFSFCSALTSVELNMGNVTNAAFMFYLCSALTDVRIDMANVTKAYSMFQGCSALTSAKFDMRNVTDASHMFSGCGKLYNVTLDMGNVHNAQYMFYECSALYYATLSMGNVHNAQYMFQGCSALINLNLYMPNVIDASYMFQFCSELNKVTLDMSNVTNASRMFSGCSGLATVSLTSPNVENASYMFGSCTKLYNVTLDMGSVTNASSMFGNVTTNLTLNITNLGKSSLTAYSFSSLSGWGMRETSRQSLVDSLITNSYDRAANGMSACKITLHANVKARLTDEEKAAITAKGFTIA